MRGNSFFSHLLVFLLFVLNGCITPSLPKSLSTSVNNIVVEPERGELINNFKRMLANQKDCLSSFDANVTLTFNSWLKSGSVSGFLQAMSPSFIKFVAVSPLGQPLLLLSTDGDQFHFIDVGQAKIFKGPVRAETFSRYAPKGFTPEYGYYWLIGRLWPGRVVITSVNRDADRQSYWIDLADGVDSMHSRVLFDPEHLVLKQHDLLDAGGNRLTRIIYANHTQGSCPLPGTISVETSDHNETLTLLMIWNETNQSYVEQDFELDLPRGFQRILVK